MLEKYVAVRNRKDVQRDIRDSLGNILDYNGELHNDFIEERSVGEDSYLRVRKEKTSIYKDPATGTEIEAPGIILSATKNVMRTEGIIVESLLGASQALDTYTSRLQEVEVERRQAETTKEKAMAEQAKLAAETVRENDTERARLLRDLRHDNGSSHPIELAVRQHNNSDHGREQE